jgi:hypothetical protein
MNAYEEKQATYQQAKTGEYANPRLGDKNGP